MAIYPNSPDSDTTQTVVGEFNQYYTRLSAQFNKPVTDEKQILINKLRVDHIMLLKKILKHFIHKETIDNDDLKYLTKLMQEIYKECYIDPKTIKQQQDQKYQRQRINKPQQQRSYNNQSNNNNRSQSINNNNIRYQSSNNNSNRPQSTNQSINRSFDQKRNNNNQFRNNRPK